VGFFIIVRISPQSAGAVVVRCIDLLIGFSIWRLPSLDLMKSVFLNVTARITKVSTDIRAPHEILRRKARKIYLRPKKSTINSCFCFSIRSIEKPSALLERFSHSPITVESNPWFPRYLNTSESHEVSVFLHCSF
jgi:hypothetical protein